MILWRRKWQPTPLFLPGKFHGRRSLVGYSPWSHKELDRTEQLHFHFHFMFKSGLLALLGIELPIHAHISGTSQVVLVVKNPPMQDSRNTGLIPGWERSPGGGQGNPLQFSYLENPMDRGAWQAMVHRITKSRTQLMELSTHAHININWK